MHTDLQPFNIAAALSDEHTIVDERTVITWDVAQRPGLSVSVAVLTDGLTTFEQLGTYKSLPVEPAPEPSRLFRTGNTVIHLGSNRRERRAYAARRRRSA